MNGSRTMEVARHTIGYFVLSFVLAWTTWILAGRYRPGEVAWVVLGGWAPTVSALVVTALSRGKAGVSRLLKSVVRWRVSIGYYAVAVFGMLALVAVATLLHVALGGSAPQLEAIAARFGVPPARPMLLLLLSPLIFLVTTVAGGPIAEELGWRGYAQRKLQAQMGAGKAGLVIGVIWSLWHLPLFWFFPSAVADFDLVAYVPLVTGFSVLFAWLYNRTRGSVLLCVLLHAGINFGLGGYGVHLISSLQGQLTVVLLVAGVAVLLYPRIDVFDPVEAGAAATAAGESRGPGVTAEEVELG